MKRVYSILLLVLFSMLDAKALHAFEGDIRDANQCITAIKHYEAKYNIPKNLLTSIALAESGRWHPKENRLIPWPWAANVEGESFFFKTKSEAVRFIKSKLKEGIKSIDVGCNQINLHHHGDNFISIEQAITPEFNSKYAAEFLSGHYNETKNWTSAVARYHSFTPHLGSSYAKRVFGIWKKSGVILSSAIGIASIKERLIELNQKQEQEQSKVSKQRAIQDKLRRSRDGIIVFSRAELPKSRIQKEEKAIIAVSERMLKHY